MKTTIDEQNSHLVAFKLLTLKYNSANKISQINFSPKLFILCFICRKNQNANKIGQKLFTIPLTVNIISSKNQNWFFHFHTFVLSTKNAAKKLILLVKKG